MDSTTYSPENSANGSAVGGFTRPIAGGAAYWYPIYAAIGIGGLGVLSSGFVLVVLFGFAKLKYLPCTQLMIHQTITDAICSAFLLLQHALFYAVNGELRNWWGYVLCNFAFTRNLFWTAFNASSFSLVSISLERYVMVVYPVFHRNHFKKSVVAGMILMHWVAGAAFTAPYITNRAVHNGQCQRVPDAIGYEKPICCATSLVLSSSR